MVKPILLLGDPELYEKSTEITEDELTRLPEWTRDLHDTLLQYRGEHGAGRAIAAPQIGIKKRLIYMLTDREYVFINPLLSFPDGEQYEVLDDCMSFPGLCVRVMRYKRAVIRWRDAEFKEHEMRLEGDTSELLQHEYDHLDGVLATMRAKDNRSLVMMEMKRSL